MLKRHLPGMTSLPAVALTAVLMLCACREDKKEFVDLKYDPETFATMTTTEVSTLISDSGLVRYRIDSPLCPGTQLEVPRRPPSGEIRQYDAP